MTLKRGLLGAALAASFAVLSGTAMAQEDIKIAYIDPFSGPFAAVGSLAAKQFFFVADQINARGGVLGGRKLVLDQFDNNMNPADTLVILQDVIDKGYDYIFQSTSGAVAATIAEAVAKHNDRNPDHPVILMNYGSPDPRLTNESCSYYYFRFGPTTYQYLAAMVADIANNADVKKVYLLNHDIGTRPVFVDGFKSMLSKARPDVEIVADEAIPLQTTKDFSPYALKIKSSGADTVVTATWGNDLAFLIKAGNDAGLTARYYTLYGGSYGTPTAIGANGDGRIFDTSPYHPSLAEELNSPELAKVYTDFKAQTGADFYIITAFYMFEMLAKAMDKAGTTDPTAVAAALEGLTYESWFGPLEMRADNHQINLPMFVARFSKDVKYDVENTGMGWKTSTTLSAADSALPTTCEMKRP